MYILDHISVVAEYTRARTSVSRYISENTHDVTTMFVYRNSMVVLLFYQQRRGVTANDIYLTTLLPNFYAWMS
jgi:hypothetical protein